jgi:hypothetical protein
VPDPVANLLQNAHDIPILALTATSMLECSGAGTTTEWLGCAGCTRATLFVVVGILGPVLALPPWVDRDLSALRGPLGIVQSPGYMLRHE